MPVTPIAHLLVDLGAPGPAAVGSSIDMESESCANRCRCEERLRDEVASARAQGYADGYERGRSERIKSEQEVAARLEAEQEARLATLASDVFDRIDVGFARVRNEISATAASVLADFFLGKIKEEAIEAAAAELSEMLSEGDAPRVVIRGPKVWVDRLAALPEVAKAGSRVEAIVCEQVDVSIAVDQAKVETAISAWIASIGAVHE